MHRKLKQLLAQGDNIKGLCQGCPAHFVCTPNYASLFANKKKEN